MAKAFSLALLLVLQLPQGGQKSTHSTRFGDLQITLLAARIASPQDIQGYKLQPRAGYNVALVFLRAKNVARYANCSALHSASLRVKQGYEYMGLDYHGFPQVHDLPPTEEKSGSIAFEIKSGMEPVAIKLVRNTVLDYTCGSIIQSRDSTPTVSPSGFASVSLSLEGLPTRAN
jgi:hypothetical protein